MPAERLQKVLAAAGVASRRASERLIEAGRVTVDGRPATLGEQVDPDAVTIAVDGRPIGPAAAAIYLLLNKPIEVTSTVRDRHADRTVVDVVPHEYRPAGMRLFPVGRLDRDSEGLIVLTNDGEWADLVIHPRRAVDREYAIALRAPLTGDQIAELERGIRLEEGVAHVTGLRPATEIETRRLVALLVPPPGEALAWYRATLRQGWKRQLRRMFGAIGAPVVRLVRVRIGTVRIGDLRTGEVRPLAPREVRSLAAPDTLSRGGSG